jgi:hypothetical protein
MKMELKEGSETSAYINQTPGNYPKGNLKHGYPLRKTLASATAKISLALVSRLFLTSTVSDLHSEAN